MREPVTGSIVTGDMVKQIIRMSQKALAWTLALIGVGYVGGMIAICICPDLARSLQEYASIFTPVWTLEIGMYGVGSTLENIQKAKAQINTINQKNDTEDDSNG